MTTYLQWKEESVGVDADGNRCEVQRIILIRPEDAAKMHRQKLLTDTVSRRTQASVMSMQDVELIQKFMSYNRAYIVQK